MAEPAKQKDPVYDNGPVTRPDLQALEGGGENSPPQGDLSVAPETKPADTSEPKLKALQGGGQSTPRRNDHLRPADESDNQDKDSADKVGKGYTPGKTRADKKGRTRFRITKKRVAAGGGITGAIVAVFVGGGSIFQGPMQIVQLGEILKKPFSSQEDSSESRIPGLLRYARSGEIGETRVSFWGSRSVAKTAEKLERIGFTAEKRTAGGGRLESIKIDTSKFDRESTTERAAFKYAAERSIPPDYISVDLKSGNKGGNFFIRNPDGGPIPNHIAREIYRGELKRLYGHKRLGKLLVALKARPVVKFNGSYSKLHPWQKGKIRTMEAAAKFEEARQARKAERKAKAQERVGRLKEKVKPIAGATGIASSASLGICIAKDIAHETPLLSYENVRMPAKDEALQVLSMHDQIKSGEDFHITQAGSLLKSKEGKNGETIWQGKALNGMAHNNGGNGEDLGNDVKSAFSSKSDAATIEGTMDAYGGSAICSTAGQVGLGALGIVALVAAAPTGGASVAAYATVAVSASVATAVAAGAITQLVPQLLADKPILTEAKYQAGPQAGNILAFGSQDLAGDFSRKNGGAELSTNASAALEKESIIADRKEFQSKSFLARTFDVRDYRSLTARAINETDFGSVQGIANTVQLSISSTPSKLLGIFLPQAKAAEDSKAYDFGFPKYGFSKEDLENPLMEDPYDNANKAAKIIESNPGFYKDRVEKCFGLDLTDGDHGWQVSLIDNPEGDPEKDVLPNTAKYISANCAEGSEDWLRIRLFIFDSRTMEAYACYEEDEEACMASGIEGTAPAASDNGQVGNVDLQQNKEKFTEILKIPDGAIGPSEVGFYHQCSDQRWSSKPYPYASGGSNSICASGCGPASLAMVISTLGNKIINPYEMGQQAKRYHVQGGTSMSGAISLVEQYGLKGRKISATGNALKEILSDGGLIIFNANPASPFTAAGHFVVIRAVSSDGSKFYVADPTDGNGNGQNRNSRVFPVSSLKGWLGPDGLWAVEKK